MFIFLAVLKKNNNDDLNFKNTWPSPVQSSMNIYFSIYFLKRSFFFLKKKTPVLFHFRFIKNTAINGKIIWITGGYGGGYGYGGENTNLTHGTTY